MAQSNIGHQQKKKKLVEIILLWTEFFTAQRLSLSPFHTSRAMRKHVLCHMRTTKAQISLRIRAFVVRCLYSVMSVVSVTKISSLILASVAEQASLILTWSETPEDMFSHVEAHTLDSCNPQNIMSRDMTKPTKWMCAQQRLRSAWASAQSDQSLRCPHEEILGP